MKITLPDGSTKEFDGPVTPAAVAASIGAGLAKAAIGAKVDGELTDLDRPIAHDASVELVTAPRQDKQGRSKGDPDPDALYLLRHSAAHVMAEAIQRLWPGAQLAYGPPLEQGFYYDIALDQPISADDFGRIESEMAKIVAEDRAFTRYELPPDRGLSRLEAEGNKYKLDNARRALDAGATALSWYATGKPGKDWEDLCMGPHLPSTGRIGAFKVMSVASSHWHGDVSSDRFQRVYGTAFFSGADLEAHLAQLEAARQRDHRVIGQRLGLFTIDDMVGPGLILWKPKGAMVRSLLQDFLQQELLKRGYEVVYTPHIGKIDLYLTSGHYPYYTDSQFPVITMVQDRAKGLIQALLDWVYGDRAVEPAAYSAHLKALGLDEAKLPYPADAAAAAQTLARVRERFVSGEHYLLKPMNCPHHIKIFASDKHSYRDLPIRLAEFGTVYRYEQSGELSGMTRVRGFTQDDAHIFCTPEQVQEEFRQTVELVQFVFNTFGFEEVSIRLSLRDPDASKYVGDPAVWDRAESELRAVLSEMGVPYTEEPGEAAFYGPKVDFVVRDVIGRRWQLGTVQLDYNLPERFGISYVGADNAEHRPVMIHRAPFGSMERFMAILIEHYNGAFPLWLAPQQARVLPISDKFLGYAERVRGELAEAGLRVAVDAGNDRLNAKVRVAQEDKVPYMLVVGGKDAEAGTVSVRHRSAGDLGAVPVAEFVARAVAERDTRAPDPAPEPAPAAG